MNNYQKAFFAACASLSSFAAMPAAADIEPVQLEFAHIYNPDDHWGIVAENFKEAVEKRSDGKITIHISPSGTTGDWPQSIEGLRMGTNQIVLQSIGTLDRYGELAGIESYPYLIRDLDHFNNVYYGSVGQDLFAAIEKQTGFHLIGAAYRGARQLSANRAIKTPEDLAGLKMRVPPLKMYRETWNQLGASPVPMGMAEVFTSLQHGLIDGEENPLEVIRNASLYEVQDYVNTTNHVMGAMTLIFSGSYFESLPEETRTILTEEGNRVMQAATMKMIATESQLRADLQSKGVTFVDSDRAAFAEKLANSDFADDFPALQPWVERIKAVK
ncbi:TRAP transporter substrate-binding protein [Salinicola sp. MIT1003]|uniref:TRAP transporter substrate-binding protein n=1 Tax=Salinicola sp. MIT1003 TaxID=1882734 RepID=UPI0008DC79B7|nr:TRAP transporter substrate-binding protein [Salinicola sp. MIT1003]OHZ01616.1 TRAP dicarboxylate transporter subunit DctP [Salinicola sp. MIT1003]